jgi:hypothetical protein
MTVKHKVGEKSKIRRRDLHPTLTTEVTEDTETLTTEITETLTTEVTEDTEI